MNRHARGPTIGGPSKATSSTLCQKCLKRDIYECKAVAQERPYVSRPSRTQQLFNPKLVPKLTNDTAQDLLRKKGIADELLAKAELDRGRKRERHSEQPEGVPLKRLRSASSSSSVSTISTSMSRSPTPPAAFDRSRKSASPARGRIVAYSPRGSGTPPDSERKRRRQSASSGDSRSRTYSRSGRDRDVSRSTRRRYQQQSPPPRGRPTESRSPQPRHGRTLPEDRPSITTDVHSAQRDRKEDVLLMRKRSLSPFSKRLALTQSMNMGR